MRFNRFIKGAALIPKDAVVNIVKSAKSARDMDSALQLIDAPIEALKKQLRGIRMKDLQDTVSRLIDDHGTRESYLCKGLDAATHDEISEDVPVMFPVIDETTVNIAYTHETRKVVNNYYMEKHAALQDDVLFIAAPTDTEEQLKKCQDVKLFAGAPLIAIKTFKKSGIYHAEMLFVVESFHRPPTGWHNLNLTQLKEVARVMGACTSGAKKQLVASIENVGVALRVRNLRSGSIKHVPPQRFHETFRIAYCITVHQSQGQTIRDRYTIYDWNLKFLCDEERARAKYVALSRGTRKDHVQIDMSDADVYDDKVLASYIKHVVLNDAFVGEKPDFDEFAVRHMLDKHYVGEPAIRFARGEIEALHGTCSAEVYEEITTSFIECCAESVVNPLAATGSTVVDGRIVMPQMKTVIFQHRYDAMLAKMVAKRDAEAAVDTLASQFVMSVIDDAVAPERKPIDIAIPLLKFARRALQMNGIDSMLQLRAYIDKRITHAVENNTSTTMREIRESALVEFGGVRRFTQRLKKAKWLKRVSKCIFEAHTPTRAHLARLYAADFISKGLGAYVATAMDL